MTRLCLICESELPAASSRNRKLCGKEECQAEQSRRLQRQSYHRLLGHGKRKERRCVVCRADITALRTNRVVCLKPECKETIVKRTKAEWYQRNAGTEQYIAQSRIANAKMRAKRTKKPVEKSKPVKPTINKSYQRVPKAASKFEIKPKPIVKPRPRIVEDDTPYVSPKPFNIPESMPQLVKTPKRTVVRSNFADPWNCQMCCNIEALCRLHQALTNDGKEPPKTFSL